MVEYGDSAFQRVLPKQSLNSKGWNSQAHRGSPGKSESTNLSSEILSMETGPRNPQPSLNLRGGDGTVD